MFSWIGIGLLVFEEYKMYSAASLCGIFGSVCLSLIGVKFLTMKHRGDKTVTRNPQEPSTPVLKEVQLSSRKM